MQNFNSLVKIDVATLVAIMGLLVAFCQAYMQWRKEVEAENKRHLKELQETTKWRTFVQQNLKFISERQDRIELWISANSGFRAGDS